MTEQKLVSMVMRNGKKSVAQKILKDALQVIKEKEGVTNAHQILEEAVSLAEPALELKSQKRGGRRFQVPQGVSKERRRFVALRWIIKESRQRKGKPIAVNLAEVLLETKYGQGPVIRRRDEWHKMAEASTNI